MIDNVLLYLSSAMLQVWAAITIYLVLRRGGDLTSVDEELQRLHRDVNEWWHHILKKLLDRNGRSLVPRLSSFGLSELDIREAEINRNAFVKVITSIQKHSLVKEIGSSFNDTIGARYFGPEDGQEKMNAVAAQVSRALEKRARIVSKKPIFAALIAMLGNLLALATLPLWPLACAKGIFISVIASLNAVFLIGVMIGDPRNLLKGDNDL